MFKQFHRSILVREMLREMLLLEEYVGSIFLFVITTFGKKQKNSCYN